MRVHILLFKLRELDAQNKLMYLSDEGCRSRYKDFGMHFNSNIPYEDVFDKELFSAFLLEFGDCVTDIIEE